MDASGIVRLEITSDSLDITELKNLVISACTNLFEQGECPVIQPMTPLRSLPSAGVIISVSGAMLVALITGFLKLKELHKAGKIVIRGPDGSALEVPVDCSVEKIRELASVVKQMGNPHISI
jgi:hypothetical protein